MLVLRRFIILLFLCVLLILSTKAQNTNMTDSVSVESKTDSTLIDTTRKVKKVFELKVSYDAQDSTRFKFYDGQKVYLYGNAVVNYGDIELKADYIEFELNKNVVFARGVKDSTGRWHGTPVFKDGKETFDADSLIYNFRTEKGVTYGVATQIEQGYLHGNVMKKHEDGYIHLSDGKFTTCDHENPHYYVALSKAKAKQGEKIISGPMWFVIADIPIPIVLPFGYFPDQKKMKSGILIPSYGEENNRGFYLRDGGYYWAASQYADIAVVGDVYTEGGWGVNVSSRYKLRYRFSGKVDVKYSKNVLGEKGTENFQKSNSYQIKWNHTQDPKARPNSSFSANVNIMSSNNQRFNSRTTNDYLSNTFGSSVSYSKRWPGSPFNFSANLRHSQNTSTKMVTLTLPSLTFSMSRQYPAEIIRKLIGKEVAAKDKKWFDKITIGYNANLDNSASEPDSIIFTQNATYKNGFKHDIPISASFKFLNHFTISPSVNYSGRAYLNSMYKHYEEFYVYKGDTIENEVVEEVVNTGFAYAHIINPNVSLAFAPKIFGFFGFKNPERHRIKVVRHSIKPRVSLNYKPKMGNDSKYYDTYLQNDRIYEYFIYENGSYRLPASSQESASMSIAINNNLEMKYKPKRDTSDELTKVALLDRFNLSTNYNFFRDSMKLSDIRVSGSTRLFKKSLSVNFGGTFDPYAVDFEGRNYDKYSFQDNQPLARLKNANLSMSMSLSPKTFQKDREDDDIPPPIFFNPLFGYSGLEYVSFKIPWNLSFNYTLNYTQSKWLAGEQKYEYKTKQYVNFSGNLNLTDNWKVGFSSGYDFNAGKLTHTSANIYRNLHCWEMRMNWIPFGTRKSYNFQINIKAAIFKDLKYKKERTHFDNMDW